ncbi:hypothetical protein [Arthrobacter sp. R-11]
MPEMFDPDQNALAALRSTPRSVKRCESCNGPLNVLTGECNCSA